MDEVLESMIRAGRDRRAAGGPGGVNLVMLRIASAGPRVSPVTGGARLTFAGLSRSVHSLSLAGPGLDGRLTGEPDEPVPGRRRPRTPEAPNIGCVLAPRLVLHAASRQLKRWCTLAR
jgi:hypothetical protein